MSGYCSIFPTFWTQGSGKELRGKKNGQLVALYLMSCPSRNMVGIFYQPLSTSCHESGLSKDDFLEGVHDARDIVQYDEEKDLIWIPKAAHFQVGKTLSPGDKRKPMVIRLVSRFLPHRFALEFFRLYGQVYGLPDPSQVGGQVDKMPHRRGIEGPSVSSGKVVSGSPFDAPSKGPCYLPPVSVECKREEGAGGGERAPIQPPDPDPPWFRPAVPDKKPDQDSTSGDEVVHLTNWKPSERARKSALEKGYSEQAIDRSAGDMRRKLRGSWNQEGLQSDYDRQWEVSWLSQERLDGGNGGHRVNNKSQVGIACGTPAELSDEERWVVETAHVLGVDTSKWGPRDRAAYGATFRRHLPDGAKPPPPLSPKSD